jgi:hypothetical protein
MAIHADTEQEALRTITLPPGPALLYVSEGDAPTVTILDRIEGGSPPDARDKAICRALLEYVLDQIDDGKSSRDALIDLGWTPPAGER